MQIRILFEKLRNQFWLVPSFIIFVSIALLVATLSLPNIYAKSLVGIFLTEGHSPEGVRLILNAIATATMTVVGVLFSLTIVVLQQASNQFSPRVIETFIRSFVSQVVLGVYIGTFTFSLLLLRQIHAGPNGKFDLPQVAISTAILLVGLCMALLIYYVHHLAHAIKSTSIITNIEEETLTYLKSYCKSIAKLQQQVHSSTELKPHMNTFRLCSTSSGYFQNLNYRKIKKCLADRHWKIDLHFLPGDYVDSEKCIATLQTDSAMNRKSILELQKSLILAPERNHSQDIRYGLRQLADIALRALSPGINDPTTALESVNRIGTIVRYMDKNGEFPRSIHLCSKGRLLFPELGFAAILDLAFEEISDSGKNFLRIQKRIRDILISINQESGNVNHQAACLKWLEKLGH